MRVKIGGYPAWIGPYQIAEKIIWWADKYNDDDVWADRQHRLGRWLAEDRHGKDSWLTKLCKWIHNTFQNGGERRVEVRIDPTDVYSADHTLAQIIAPTLRMLKHKKNGSPNIDNDDLPEHLRMDAYELRVFNDGHWDHSLNATEPDKAAANKKFHAGWDWVLDEMIWAFAQHEQGNWEDQFHSGEHDMLWQKVDVHGTPIGEPVARTSDAPSDGQKQDHLWQMLRGPKDTHAYDSDGAKAWSDRMANGRRLFAKYYESLWW